MIEGRDVMQWLDATVPERKLLGTPPPEPLSSKNSVAPQLTQTQLVLSEQCAMLVETIANALSSD
jgi:hypothetical protein